MHPQRPISKCASNHQITDSADSILLQCSISEKWVEGDFTETHLSNNDRPAVILVCGLPGSGKTYFSVRFACLIDAGYLGTEQLRLKLFERGTNTNAEKLVIYERMLQKAKHILTSKRSLVLDGTFYDRKIRNMFLEELKNLGEVLFIEIRASESLSHERIKKKRSDSEAPYTIFNKIKRQWDLFSSEHLVLQSTQLNILDMLNLALQYYKRRIRIRN